MTDITGLRERRRLATSAEIEAAAFALFEQRGSEHTTVDDIAAAAGVSPRTFFRYFPTKEDAVLGVKRAFFETVSESFARGLDLAGATAEALAEFSAGDSVPLRRMMQLRCLCKVDDNLRQASLVLDSEQCRLRQEEVAAAGGAQAALRARIAVETLTVVLNAALDEWATRRVAGEPADLVDVFRITCALQRQLCP
ncbi:TetR family transcriptional regulator [Cryptosporangium phraense]|uniref:TetR family transcriptional regulator n=1 Tax=Cryptosporangium phraense TaxID=2593070 RepID=UPI001F0EB61D|nr:TetR family transcriptional regulator [Cryptosporangium phraense]